VLIKTPKITEELLARAPRKDTNGKENSSNVTQVHYMQEFAFSNLAAIGI
jgi:hypothetical protein